MWRSAVITSFAFLATGCASVTAPVAPLVQVVPFSANRPDVTTPQHWEPLIIAPAKAPTDYRLVHDDQAGTLVVHARARKSATGLRQPLDVDSAQRPRVAWRTPERRSAMWTAAGRPRSTTSGQAARIALRISLPERSCSESRARSILPVGPLVLLVPLVLMGSASHSGVV